MDQTDKPLVATQGHLMDSVGLGVGDLDAWVAKLKAENVTFLRQVFQDRRHARRDDRRPQP